MQKQVILSILLALSLLCVNAQEFRLHSQELNANVFTESDITGWTNNKGITSYLTNCGGKTLLGGTGKFSQRTELQKTFSDLPSHTELKIEFQVYKIDSWDGGVNGESLFISGGGDQLGRLSKVHHNTGVPLCGVSFWNDEVQNVSFTIEHSGDSFELSFRDTLDEVPTNESWGIRDIKIYLKGCAEGEQLIGDECFSREELTQCSDSLKPLIDNIQSDCTQEEAEEEFYYKFNIDYVAPYEHNADCFTQEIYVEETKLQQGESLFDEWAFDGKQIVFSIKQDDLEDKYGCTRTEDDEQFSWSCDFQLHLLLGGEVIQHKFNFEMKATLDKAQRDVLNLKVTYDESSDECCENELNIDTELKFCKTFECLEYHELPYTVKRSEEIFLEHSISSPDFLNYYLHPSEVVIFGVVADILEVDGSNTGKLIYKVKSQLAFDDMLVEVISILDDEEYQAERRFLQGSSTIRADYDIKAISQISVVPEAKSSINTQQSLDTKSVSEEESTNEQEVQALTIGLISASALIGLLVIAGLSFVCYRRYSKNSRKANYHENVTQNTQKTEEVESQN